MEAKPGEGTEVLFRIPFYTVVFVLWFTGEGGSLNMAIFCR